MLSILVLQCRYPLMATESQHLEVGAAPSYSNNSPGEVHIYDYTPTGVSSWTQVGAEIVSASANEFGRSVSLSANGSLVAVGDHTITELSNYHAQIYSWNGNGINLAMTLMDRLTTLIWVLL